MVIVLGDSDSQEKLSSPLKAEIATEENRKQANLAELNVTQADNRTTYIIPESSHSIAEQQRFLIDQRVLRLHYLIALNLERQRERIEVLKGIS
ncbi:hypothetical protein SAG0322_04615 [Streptococcus agalactiae GB00264]|uniref:hypothetical protein n=1 Tax=Streptococcus agalactiae TaxID=1311 RepID=UPI0002BB3196|nr:hypothetical protein [Streptococcus agalactiae]EPU97505.1 hypothetical protein SAG0322_04615 [Streptococcus agalactiae GB00264]